MLTKTTDLKEIRSELDEMAKYLISRMWYRSIFPFNASIYEENGVTIKGMENVKYLDLWIEGLEKLHQELGGRFEYKDQHTLVSNKQDLPQSLIERRQSEFPIADVEIDVKDAVKNKYVNFIKQLCAPGENPDTYGESAYVDSDLMLYLYERINVGRFVAESKYRQEPTIKEVINDRDALEKKLRVPHREKEVIASVKGIAEMYKLDPANPDKHGFSPEQIEKIGEFFQWIIDMTTEVEIQYLQKAYGNDT